ncbi:MAG: thiamine pyrophosphate-binding protein [Clostridium sp.]|nr:thiamine pyrophosphate-binding protein [Clostridium sp.]
MKRRVADIIMDILVENNITDCFAVVGGGAMHLDNALALNKKIKKIFNHNEQACSMAAEAYARLSGKIAAVCVTSGPGATNTLTGVMGAWQDSLPMIILSGQVRYQISVKKSGLPLRYRGIQEFDIVPTVKNMTKYAVMITDPLSIKKEIYKALKIAMDGRRGPVWLDVPQDIQSAVVEEADLYPIEEDKNYYKSIDVSALNKIMKNAVRPCILAGSGIRSGNVMNEFLNFVQNQQIPVIGGAWVADVMYMNHPLYYGASGNVGPRTGNFILQNSDVILVLGNSLGFRQTGFNQDEFAPKAKIIMVDADENEAKKPGLNIELFIHSDLKNFFSILEGHKIDTEISESWREYCSNLKVRFNAFEALSELEMDGRVNSYYFWKKFEENEPKDSIVALGNNTANTAKLQIGINEKEQRVLTNYTCGSMGYDLPAAIGGAVASGKNVVCVTGDGSIMMNLQELQTIRHYNLPINVVVFSNDGYAAIRQTSENFFNGVYIGCNKETGVSFPDFKSVAETFGFKYIKCSSNAELENKIKEIFDFKERVLLEVEQMLNNPVIPKVMSRTDENGNMLTPALHDMSPFLSEEEIKSLMIQ